MSTSMSMSNNLEFDVGLRAPQMPSELHSLVANPFRVERLLESSCSDSVDNRITQGVKAQE